MGPFTDMLILVHVFVLWKHTEDFPKLLSANKILIGDSEARLASIWVKIKEEYDNLASLARKINAAVGDSVTLFLLELLFNYITVVDDDEIFINAQPDWKTLLNHIFYLCMDVPAILILSAEICTKVSPAVY